MSGDWGEAALGDVCAFINRGISPKYIEVGGLRVVNQRCIRDHRVSYDLARRHDTSVKPVSRDRVIQLGDVLVNSTGTGTLGRVAQVREAPGEPTTVDSHVTIVRPKIGVFDRDFFGYMLVDIENALKDAGEGCGGQTELARSVLATRFKVRFPRSLAEQRHIVAALDEAFAGIAAARSNAERNLRNARALFGSRRAASFSPMGSLAPEVSFADVCEITSALIDPREASYADMPHVGGANITSKTGQLTDVMTAREEGLTSGKFAFDGSAVLYSKIRPYLMKVARPDFDGLCSADVYPLSPKPNTLDRDYLFHLLLSPQFTEYAVAGSARAGMPKVNREHLFAYRLHLPPLARQREIARQLDSLARETQRLAGVYTRKLAALDELKQSLLHHAFTGQLTASRPKRARPVGLTSPLDRHAGVLAIAHRLHVRRGREHTFGRVKAEKVAHLVESHLGIDLGRTPVKEAAGPYDRRQRALVQRHAREAGYFVFEGSRAAGYHVRELDHFDALVKRTRAGLGDRYADVARLVELMAPMRMHHAEVFATTYAAWNNLLLDGRPVTDEAIVREAREDWHPKKLRIPPEHFLKTIAWMRRRAVTPSGTGKRVVDSASSSGGD